MEEYTTPKGEVYEIKAREGFEPRGGDYAGVYFSVVRKGETNPAWSCTIKVAGSLLATWNKLDVEDQEKYRIVKELGILKIKSALKIGGQFQEFSFTTGNSESTFERQLDWFKSAI